MRDTVGLFMLATGGDPANPSMQSADPAFEALQKGLDDGQINGANGNDYVADLGAGNLAAAFAWSGDVAQITLDNPDVRFAVPDSGGMLWSDNFLIPIGTDKVNQASQWINFFYDPDERGRPDRRNPVHLARAGRRRRADGDGRRRGRARRQPARRPDRGVPRASCAIFGTLDEAAEEEFDQRFSEILGTG